MEFWLNYSIEITFPQYITVHKYTRVTKCFTRLPFLQSALSAVQYYGLNIPPDINFPHVHGKLPFG